MELVIVRFKAIGNAPLLKQTKFKITSTESFQTIMDFLRRQLKFQPHESLVSNLLVIIPPPAVVVVVVWAYGVIGKFVNMKEYMISMRLLE